MSYNRCLDPGWVLVAMHDPAGRRGVWIRDLDDVIGRVEICFGREGDDHMMSCERGDPLHGKLRELASWARWIQELVDEEQRLTRWQRPECSSGYASSELGRCKQLKGGTDV